MTISLSSEYGSQTKSVLQIWVMALTLRQQGVLCLALRGPDGTPKESNTKSIIRSLRACVMNSGRHGTPLKPNEVMAGDSFMRMDLISDSLKWRGAASKFYGDIDAMNVHFLQHLLHAAALCRQYPHSVVAMNWWDFYITGCKKLHMHPETLEEITNRLRDGRREDQDE